MGNTWGRIVCALLGHAAEIRIPLLGGFRCSRCHTATVSLGYDRTDEGYVNPDRPIFTRTATGGLIANYREEKGRAEP